MVVSVRARACVAHNDTEYPSNPLVFMILNSFAIKRFYGANMHAARPKIIRNMRKAKLPLLKYGCCAVNVQLCFGNFMVQ